MKVNIDSWHFKLIERTTINKFDLPHNLCDYIRALSWRLLVILVIVSVVLPSLVIAPIIVHQSADYNTLQEFMVRFDGILQAYMWVTTILGVVEYLLLAVFLVVFLQETIERLLKRYRERHTSGSPPQRMSMYKAKPSKEPKPPHFQLLKEWLKALKEKTCPLIEYDRWD